MNLVGDTTSMESVSSVTDNFGVIKPDEEVRTFPSCIIFTDEILDQMQSYTMYIQPCSSQKLYRSIMPSNLLAIVSIQLICWIDDRLTTLAVHIWSFSHQYPQQYCMLRRLAISPTTRLTSDQPQILTNCARIAGRNSYRNRMVCLPRVAGPHILTTHEI